MRVPVLTAVVAALLVAAPAGAATSQEAVGFLNQQRQANGIPSGVAFDSYRTTGCYNHNRYMEQNGLGHHEDPSKPGYTPEGADYTNSGEVLAQGFPGFTATSNPWDTAPLHQTLLFDPPVNSAGYDEYNSFSCMRFGFNFTSSPQPVFYAFTSDTGRVSVPYREIVAGEGPYAPQEAVGIPQGVATGPNILFFIEGFGSTNHAVLYNLIGPGKRGVDVKLVDSTTPPPSGNTYQAFSTGGDMIPVKPLVPATNYTANVVWKNDDSGATSSPQSVAFKTSGQARTLTLSLSKKLSKSRRATLKAPAEVTVEAQRAIVRIQLAKKGRSLKTVSTKTIVLKRTQTIKVPKPSKGGRAVVRVTLPTFALGETRYDTTPASRTYH